MILPGKTIGIIGNGQLGRMSAMEAKKMGFRVGVFGPGENSPAEQVCDFSMVAEYADTDKVEEFSNRCDVITFEFENIPFSQMMVVKGHAPVHPSPDILMISQHRLTEKSWMKKNGFPVTEFLEITRPEQIDDARKMWNTQAVLKTSTLGYDGKGQIKINQQSDVYQAFQKLHPSEMILEKWVTYEKELSVIVASNGKGDYQTWDIFENIHTHHILDVTIYPSRISEKVSRLAQEMAIQIAKKMELIGLLTIELFLTSDGNLLVNEIAPRPHNSGHITFDCSSISQFQQHIRSVCQLPLGVPQQLSPGLMINILGDSWSGGQPQWEKLLAVPGLNLHLYGKNDPKTGRKMGHVNLIGEKNLNERIKQVRNILNQSPIQL